MRPGKKFTYGFLPTLLCLMAMFIAACGGSAPTQTSGTTKASADKQIYRFTEAGVADLGTFDPAIASDIVSLNAVLMVYTGLVFFDDQLNVKGQLASSWDQSPDGLTWTFHLKPNLKFSDGTPLTSADVAYSIDRALLPATKSPTAGSYLNLIKDSDKVIAGKIPTVIGDSILTPDPNTVVIVANNKAAYFLDTLTYASSYVVEKSLVTKYGNNFTDHLNEGGGAGPFMVQQYTHGKEIDFVPNPNYYGPHPQLQKVIYAFYKDVKTAYQAYQVGQLDITPIPSANLAAARKLTKEFHEYPELSIFYYGPNFLAKPFDNQHIREAFELAINKDVIAHAVWKDTRFATCHIVPKGMPGYNADLKCPEGAPTSGDPAKARQLLQMGLQEGGYASVSALPPIKFTYETGSADFDNQVTTTIGMWQSVLGVTVKPDPVDFEKLVTESQAMIGNPKGLQFLALGWGADYPDPQDWLTLQFDKGSPNNNWNFGQNHGANAAQEQALQQQMEQADIMPPGDARLKTYENIEQQLVNDVAWMPMFQRNITRLLKSYVIGRVFNALSEIPPDDWANVYIAAH